MKIKPVLGLDFFDGKYRFIKGEGKVLS